MFILRIDKSQDPYARDQVTFAVAGAILINDTQLFNLLPSKFRWDFGVFLGDYKSRIIHEDTQRIIIVESFLCMETTDWQPGLRILTAPTQGICHF